MEQLYPFSALVGQEELKTALLLSCVDPALGGVLIQGEKGTAKTTAVRGLAALLENYAGFDRPDTLTIAGDLPGTVPVSSSILTELPLNATEDRIAGSIQLEGILRDGTRRFEPGLLARSHLGILYVDEVNLLESHLVDILLDAAATGVNRVEREGLSISHPSRFVLVGTMNPEEGELRPQFLDRFGLTVLIDGLMNPADRSEIIRRRLAFDADPAGFRREWENEERSLAESLRVARAALPGVAVGDTATDLAVELCGRAGVAGHRADITLIRGARALAALTEADAVDRTHIEAIARYVLPHRLPKSGIEGIADLTRRTDELIGGGAHPGGGDGAAADSDRGQLYDPYDETEIPGATAAGSLLFEHFKKKLPNLKLRPPNRGL